MGLASVEQMIVGAKNRREMPCMAGDTVIVTDHSGIVEWRTFDSLIRRIPRNKEPVALKPLLRANRGSAR